MNSNHETNPDSTASPAAKERSPRQPAAIVALGASAGGLEVLQNFFSAMPTDSGVAFIVIQHLDPDHATLMPELLGRITKMPVVLIEDGMRAEPDRVHVISPNSSLSISDGVLHAELPPESRGHRMPIDRFFHSLARDQGERAVAIVLSGTGSDGMLGLNSVKEVGGLVVAQDPAEHTGMPSSAASTGLVDFVIPVEEMPACLSRYVDFLAESPRPEKHPLSTDSLGDLQRICAMLLKQTGHDFSEYKDGTLTRRIWRRIQLLGVDSAASYGDRLERDPEEVTQLFKELLIGVTHFFRDPEAFEILEEKVVPDLFRDRDPEDPVRVWVAGCSTGEEAYSLAILLREHADQMENPPRVLIFATDIDEAALAVAREARYPESIEEQISPERIERFFTKVGKQYRAVKSIREMILFSVQNLIKDPPFSSLDIVSCRNVLIYFGSGLQRRLTPLFHYALRPGGTLLLGPSENLPGSSELFRVLDKKTRVHRSRDVSPRPHVEFPLSGGVRPLRRESNSGGHLPWADSTLTRKVERVLVEHFTPTCVVVSESGDVVYFSGRTGRYLEPAVGAPSANIHHMARRGLRLDLRTALHQAVASKQMVRRSGVTYEIDDGEAAVDLIVRPLAEAGEDGNLYLTIFQDSEDGQSGSQNPAPIADGDETAMRHLEEELRSTRIELQSTIEQVETANEELKSSNEELLSMNEELQSSNEELQTSKEELQSMNEELNTVNAELHQKLEELDRTNSDLKNLFDSSHVATVFLDREMRVQRFTPAATEVFRLIDADVGRSLVDITNRLSDRHLIEDFREVLETLVPLEREVQIKDDGANYIMRIRPYQTLDNVIDGVVVTFVDVTQIKVAEEEALRQHTTIQRMADSMPVLFAYCDAEERYQFVNSQYKKWFGVEPDAILGRTVRDVVGTEAYAEVEPKIQRVLAGETLSFQSNLKYSLGGARDVQVEYIPQRSINDQIVGYYAMVVDVTEQTRAQEFARQRAAHRDALTALASSALEHRNSADLIDEAVTLLAETLSVEFTKVLKLLPAGDELLLISGVGWPADLINQARVSNDSDSHAGYTLDADSPVVVPDMGNEQRFRPDSLLFEHEIRSGISMVIMGVELDRPFGVLSAHTRQLRSFTADEVDFVRRVAAIVTAALNRDRYDSALEDADRRKDEFLAMLAHELRNPLTPLRFGLATLSRSGGGIAPDRVAEVQGMMERQITLMTRLLDDLLDASRVSLGRIELQQETIDVREIVEISLEGREGLPDDETNRISISTPDDPIYVEGDTARLVQVVRNLLHNAEKFSVDSDEIAISIRLSDGGVEVAIRDRGIGIEADLLSKVFDLFRQGDNTRSRARGGLGIGLTLVRTLVELHGGRVHAESDGPGQGSEFVIWLPVVEPPVFEEKPEPPPVKAASPRRILVVDDNEDACVTTAKLLSSRGYEVRTAEGGRQALEIAPDFKPQVVFLDLGMPGMDGLETAKQLRSTEDCRESLLIAMTGYGDDDARSESRAAGFDLHLVKPASVTDLFAAVDRS